MNVNAKRRLQLAIGLSILAVAFVLSYYSIDERTNPVYDIYLALDVSESMSDQSKLKNAKSASATFIDSLSYSKDTRVGLIIFQSEAGILSKPTAELNSLKNIVQTLRPGGDTAMGDAIKIATDSFTNEGRLNATKVILLLTDGMATVGIHPVDASRFASQNDVIIYTVGYGLDADSNTLEEIATLSGGQYFQAQSGQDVVNVFNRISKLLISPLAHYGSRVLVFVAIPILLFMPLLEKMAVTMIQKAEQTFIDKRGPQKSYCAKCGYKNKPNSKFCAKCGFRIR